MGADGLAVFDVGLEIHMVSPRGIGSGDLGVLGR